MTQLSLETMVVVFSSQHDVGAGIMIQLSLGIMYMAFLIHGRIFSSSSSESKEDVSRNIVPFGNNKYDG